jgi:hypothetical protein
MIAVVARLGVGTQRQMADEVVVQALVSLPIFYLRCAYSILVVVI